MTDLGWPALEDGLLAVRPFELEDAAAVAAACSDPDIAHWIYGLPSPYTLADAEEFIRGARDSLTAGVRARMAITDCASGDLLGSVSLDLRAERQAGEIGYWVRREARRRGVVLAAARLVVRWAFEGLGLERLEILAYPGNAASQALAGKLGFTREGLLRGFLAAEPGKDRAGRVLTPADTDPAGASPAAGPDEAAAAAQPPRDDQVLFALLRSDWAG